MTDNANPASGQPALRPICAHCGSDRIVRDACARWDALAGQWLLAELRGLYFCDACNAEGHVSPGWGVAGTSGRHENLQSP